VHQHRALGPARNPPWRVGVPPPSSIRFPE
jgi:hypothetical protein